MIEGCGSLRSKWFHCEEQGRYKRSIIKDMRQIMQDEARGGADTIWGFFIPAYHALDILAI